MTKTMTKLAVAIAALLPTSALADWNGVYAGVSAGQFSEGEWIFDNVLSFEIDDAETFGLFFGTMAKSNQLVYGFEAELMSADEPIIQSGRGDVVASPIVDLKMRVGYDLGNVLPYGVVGLSTMSIEGPLSTNVTSAGLNYGLGVDYLIANRFIVGIEYLARRTSGEVEVEGFFGTSEIEVNSDNLSIRAAYKF
jgi:outer membrane immunogenic protein